MKSIHTEEASCLYWAARFVTLFALVVVAFLSQVLVMMLRQLFVYLLYLFPLPHHHLPRLLSRRRLPVSAWTLPMSSLMVMSQMGALQNSVRRQYLSQVLRPQRRSREPRPRLCAGCA